ncbi:MAG: hypothetical protein IKH54_04705 [Bacilli bacterium]|nr:hypothetical protein [Bacilli bacterium]
MKKHNAIKVILVTTLICVILTWIFKAAYFQSEFVDQGLVQMGLFDLFSYSLTSLSYFGYVALYMICVGGFYGILNKIPAYHKLVSGISNKMSKHSVVWLSVMIVLIGIITSVCGLQLGLILFFPFVATIVLLMGFDKIVVALTLVGSSMAGIIGTTTGYSNVGLLNSYLGTDVTNNIPLKIAILIVALFLVILNTVLYIRRNNKVVSVKKVEKVSEESTKEEKIKVVEVKEKEAVKESNSKKKEVSKKTTKTDSKSTSKSTKKSGSKKSSSKSKNNNKAAVLDEEVIMIKNEKFDNKVKVWPLVIGLFILFVVMILAFIPWSDVFGFNGMATASEAVKGFKIFKFELFGKLLGSFNTFGDWMITDMFLPMTFVIILLAIIYKVKINDLFDGFAEGAKKALLPALTSLLVYVVLVINTYHPFQLTFYKAILGIGGGAKLNVFTTTFTAILSSLFNVEPSYAFQAFVPYLTSIVTNQDVYPVIEIISQAMYGFTMIFAPTSVVLMAVISALEIRYKDWLKAIWKLLVELLVVLLIIFTIVILL